MIYAYLPLPPPSLSLFLAVFLSLPRRIEVIRLILGRKYPWARDFCEAPRVTFLEKVGARQSRGGSFARRRATVGSRELLSPAGEKLWNFSIVVSAFVRDILLTVYFVLSVADLLDNQLLQGE